MTILHIEHKVPNYDGWKKVFDSDPIDRKKMKVRSYNIFRPEDDPGYVIVHLAFDNEEDANNTLSALRKLWTNVEGKVIMNPQTRLLTLVENVVV
jgi:hypothetical protein